MRNHLEQFVKYKYKAIMLIEPPHDLGSWTLVAKLQLCDDKKQYEAYVKDNLGYIFEFTT